MRLCTALVRGKRGECQDAVPEDSDVSLCLLHMLMAHQDVQRRGGAQKVAEMIRATVARIAVKGAS